MFYQYKTTLRKIFKQKITSIINLSGLILSISAFLFIISWILSEKSYDRFWNGYDRIYRVALTKKVNGSPVLNTAMNYPGAGQVLQNEFPEIEAATKFGKDFITVFTAENSYQDVNFYYIDSSFFKIFPRHYVSENSEIFADIHGAIISKSMAKKLFGSENPLTRKFKLNEGWEFFVCAVFDDFPENSHIKADVLIQWKALFYYMNNFNYSTGILDDDHISEISENDPYGRNEWSYMYSHTYIKLKQGKNNISDLVSKYKKTIQPCIKHIQDAGEDIEFAFQPVSSIHLSSKLNDEISVNGSNFRIKAFGIIGLLIIIISWFNYMNLSIAVQMKQAAKDKVKRIIGASKGHLFLQHFSETLTIHAFAGITAISLISLIIRNGVHFTGFNIYSVNYVGLVVICFLLVITGTLFSSFYPFFKTLRITSTNNLKKAVTNGPQNIFSRQTLLILQFSVAILLIICTSIVFKQIWFMQKQDLGANLNHVMVSYSPMTMIKKPSQQTKLKAFQDEVMRTSGVVSFTSAETIPGKEFRRSSSNVHLDDSQENKYLFSLASIDQNYFDFFSIKILAGSIFLPSSDYEGNSVILNSTARKRLGISDDQSAIDRMVTINDNSYRIIGVVDDYHHLSLKDEIAPVIFFKSLQWHFNIGYYCIKILPVNLESTINKVAQVWGSVYPDEPYLYSFLDNSFNALYNEEKKFGGTYLFFSIIAIFIACMGLFALARISAENKIKEIGIRKVNGATVVKIMAMLNQNYIKWVLVAFIIACPIAWYILKKWLQNFAYKTDLSWWVFPAAGIVALGIALLTVSWQSWRAATRNPVEALRYE